MKEKRKKLNSNKKWKEKWNEKWEKKTDITINLNRDIQERLTLEYSAIKGLINHLRNVIYHPLSFQEYYM